MSAVFKEKVQPVNICDVLGRNRATGIADRRQGKKCS